MRILFVIDTYDTNNNGTSISAQRFAAELRRRGHEVKILTSGEPGEDRFALPTYKMPIFQPLMDKHNFNFAYSEKKTIREAVEWADIIHCFLPFAIEVEAKRYADKIQLIFAGKGPEYDHYMELGKQLKNPPQFVYLEQQKLINLLLQCDLYVHASDMESEAISCIEAFATGLVPVIANSEVSATPQFALDGRSLFKAGSPKDLARAIDYWLDHPNERKYMGELYRVAAKKYSLANSVRMFEEMLNEEIEDNAKQHAQA